MKADFLKKKPFVIMISIIWGFGLACIFREAFVKRDEIQIRALHPNKVIGKIFKGADGNCYSYIPKSAVCNKNPIY
jgi:hypothetical protein